MLITSFGDGAGSKLKAVKQLPFEVTANRVVTQAPAKQLSIQMETAAQEISGRRHHAFVQMDISYRNEDPPSILSMDLRVLK